MPRVLYIAGYGRSGSTVLSIVLGSHPDIAAVGELTHLLEDWATSGRVCSCGRPYNLCPFWGALFAGSPPPAGLAQLVRKIDARPGAVAFPAWRLSAGDVRAYRDFQRTVFDYVAARTGKSIVVDSSKSARLAAGRPWALTRLAEQDVYVLHLVRSGRATLDSLVRTGSNWALEGQTGRRRLAGTRGLLGWMRANLRVSRLGRRVGPTRYLFMRYEDFLADPVSWLRRIGGFLGVDAEELGRRAERGHEFVAPHLVGGNRLRMQPTVRLWREDTTAGQPPLQPQYRVMFRLFAGWLERRYGYYGPVTGPARTRTDSER